MHFCTIWQCLCTWLAFWVCNYLTCSLKCVQTNQSHPYIWLTNYVESIDTIQNQWHFMYHVMKIICFKMNLMGLLSCSTICWTFEESLLRAYFNFYLWIWCVGEEFFFPTLSRMWQFILSWYIFSTWPWGMPFCFQTNIWVWKIMQIWIQVYIWFQK